MHAWLERRSIGSRVGLLLLAILLPVVGALAWQMAKNLRLAQEAARDRVSGLASNTAKDLQHRLADAERAMASLAARPEVQALGAEVCDSLVDELHVLTPGFRALTVLDPQDGVVCRGSVTGPVASGDAAPPSRQTQTAPGQVGLQVGPLAVGGGPGARTLSMGHPIHSGRGHGLGRLEIELDPLMMSRAILPPAADGAETTVLDASQRVLLQSTDPAGRIGGPADVGEIAPVAKAGQGHFENRAGDGTRRLYAFVDLPRGGLRVVSSLPLADVMADYHRTRVQMLAVGTPLALLVLALGWRLTASIVQPVAGLRAAVERAAAGDGSARSPVSGPPEVRAVAKVFNQALDDHALCDSRLRAVFASAMDAIITCDHSMHIVEANPAAAKMFRCDIDRMIGAPLDRFIPARLRQAHAQHVRRFREDGAAASQPPLDRMVLAMRADGVEFPIEASVSTVGVGDKQLYTVIHRDVTERKRAESALRKSEARLRGLLAYLPDAVIVATGAHIEFVNPAACALLGADDQVLLGQPLQGFVAADARAHFAAALAAGGAGLPAELTIQRADGGVRQVESVATPFENNGGGLSTLIVLRDISALKRAQVELDASHADLTRLVAELDNIQEAERSRIAREVHDDLQQTLAAIRMDVRTIASALQGDQMDVQPALARVDALAGGAIASTRRIINDLRPQVLETLGLVPALETLATGFELRHGVTCSLLAAGVPADSAGIGQATSTCLYRVAQEALNNVAKHAQASHVQMELDMVGSDCLRLVVSDDGRGLAEADLRKPQSYGLLGMRERVRAAHGSLQVESTPGQGTTLTIEIPGPAA